MNCLKLRPVAEYHAQPELSSGGGLVGVVKDIMPSSQSVLIIGLNPRAVPGVDADLVEQAVARGQSRFDGQGIDADLCLVGPNVTAESEIAEHLKRKEYACVVVGGGIRKPEPLLELFETVINLIRHHAPGAAIAFNTNAENSIDAAMRWLPANEA